MRNPGYAVIGVYVNDRLNLLNVDGKVVVFDTPTMAQWAVPRLGGGRREIWSSDGESVYFEPIRPGGINRAVIITGYDAYHLPARWPVISEAKGRDWKRHVHWYEVIKSIGQQMDEKEAQDAANLRETREAASRSRGPSRSRLLSACR